MEHLLTCPVCSDQLKTIEHSLSKTKSVKCSRNHLFDFAKQGYLNLLLSQHKKSKQPGDTPEMVQARTHFLSKGYYDGISQFLTNICMSHLPECETVLNNKHVGFHYCDLACGEGFYTNNLHKTIQSSSGIQQTFKTLMTTGLDISSPAIKSACRKNQDIQWLIASLARIPIEDNSQHLVTGLFFHFDLKEVTRILKRGGIFVMVTTGKNHLIELRNEIYDSLKDEIPKDFSGVQDELAHINKLSYSDKKTLTSPEDILCLLKMTPHYWRCTVDKKQQLESLSKLTITIDIQFDIFTKR